MKSMKIMMAVLAVVAIYTTSAKARMACISPDPLVRGGYSISGDGMKTMRVTPDALRRGGYTISTQW